MASTVSTSTRYCRRCGYALTGLATFRCPECGREFDPANPRSTARSPRRYRRTTGIAGAILAAIALLLSAPVIWLYCGWRGEHAAVTQKQYRLITDQPAPIGPTWAAHWLGTHAYWLDRDRRMIVYCNDVVAPSADPLAAVARFHWIEDLQLRGSTNPPTQHSADYAPLSSLSAVKLLLISGEGIDDSVLLRLQNLIALDKVYLSRLPQVTGMGLAFLRTSGRIRLLSIDDVPANDQALAQIDFSNKKELNNIGLVNTNVGDETIKAISELPELDTLAISGGLLTDASVAYLAQAKKLDNLCLVRVRLQGDTLGELAKDKVLRRLDLKFTDVDDNALKKLDGVQTVTSLSLTGTRVTLAGVRHVLDSHPKLRSIDLDAIKGSRDEFSMQEIDALRKAYPSRTIAYEVYSTSTW